MKKFTKLFLLILLMFSISGCSTEHELVIDDNGMTEKINIIVPKTEENKTKIYGQYQNNLYAIDNDYTKKMYDKKISENEDNYVLTYKVNYEFSEIKFDYLFSTCFDSYSAVKGNDNTFIISTSKGYNCLYYEMGNFDKYELKIRTKYNVLETNADSIDKDVMKWNIDFTNYENKNIYLKISLEKNKKNISAYGILIIIFASILVLSGIIFLIVKAINKKNNKI